MRLQEAICSPQWTQALEPAVRAVIPDHASTLHRLLRVNPDSSTPRYHRDHPLPVDVLVVDEASMVDLALMAKTVDALPSRARLILLGDRDQLASVEAGAVLSDICGTSPALSTSFRECLQRMTGEVTPATPPCSAPLADVVMALKRSYRFGKESGIGQLARSRERRRSRKGSQLCARKAVSGSGLDPHCVACRVARLPVGTYSKKSCALSATRQKGS